MLMCAFALPIDRDNLKSQALMETLVLFYKEYKRNTKVK